MPLRMIQAHDAGPRQLVSPRFLPPPDNIPQEGQADSTGALRQSPEVRIPNALVHLRHRLFLIARLPDARAADHKLARRLVCSRGGLCGRLCAAVQGMSVSTRRSKPCGETHESKCLASQYAVLACAEVVYMQACTWHEYLSPSLAPLPLSS